MPFSAPASVFEQALATFPSASQDLILQAMAAWSTADALGPRVVANLRKERFLSVAHMRELLAVLLDHGTREPVDWAALRRAYISTCWQRSLEGNEVLLEPRPSMIGRAVTRDRFVRQVFDAFNDRPPRSVTLSQVEEFIDDLLTSPDPEIPIEKAGWLMSRRASWVTWNEHDPGGDPFSFGRTGTSIEVAACLGLKWNRLGPNPPLVLIVCERPDACALLRPTVADAADYEYFTPPDPALGDAHGWTMPWPPGEIQPPLTSATVRARPEAIHGPIELRCLNLKIGLRILR